MVRLVGAIAILTGSVGIGWSMANEAREEIRHLEEILQMTGFLSGEISCYNALLCDGAENASHHLQSPYSDFLRKVSDEINRKSGECFSDIWSRMTDESFLTCIWKKEEWESFRKLGEHLGYLNQTMQISMIDQYRTELEERIRKKRKSLDGKIKLYNSLGLMGGLFLIILLL